MAGAGKRKAAAAVPWTPEADKVLLATVATGGLIDLAAYRLDRTVDACRERLAELPSPVVGEALDTVRASPVFQLLSGRHQGFVLLAMAGLPPKLIGQLTASRANYVSVTLADARRAGIPIPYFDKRDHPEPAPTPPESSDAAKIAALPDYLRRIAELTLSGLRPIEVADRLVLPSGTVTSYLGIIRNRGIALPKFGQGKKTVRQHAPVPPAPVKARAPTASRTFSNARAFACGAAAVVERSETAGGVRIDFLVCTCGDEHRRTATAGGPSRRPLEGVRSARVVGSGRSLAADAL